MELFTGMKFKYKGNVVSVKHIAKDSVRLNTMTGDDITVSIADLKKNMKRENTRSAIIARRIHAAEA